MTQPSSNRLAWIAWGLAALCALALIGVVGKQESELSRLAAQLDQETAMVQLNHDESVRREQEAEAAEIAAKESAQAARLQDPALLSGELARQRHNEEWERRLAHDPTMAQSAMEKTLLSMERVGHDPARQAQEALAEVARLAAPAGSRIEVTPKGDRFEVKVAFRMSALSVNEAGPVTKHHSTESMRREIRELSAGVMKSLFDYCGSRGIEKLSVTCNHAIFRTAVPENATAWEKSELLRRAPVVLGRLYRASLDSQSARGVPDWRRVPVRKVSSMMTVELDGLDKLEISGLSFGEEVDPQGELEF